MNITFENGRAENEVRQTNSPGARSGADKTTTSQVASPIFALDISGTVMDNTAYEGQGKTAEDVMQDAGQIDVATQKNYMAVMSNTVSEEDFARLQEEGCHPGSTEIETVVTIVDEIKAALARGGRNIAGYNDDLDVKTLTEITGNSGLAQEMVKQFREHDIPVTKENAEDVLKACDTVMRLDSLSDGTLKYMIRNQMDPTVDNIYRAQYSAADTDKQGRGYYQDDAGYYAKKAEDCNWQQLQPQMEKVIENAGLAVSDETLADARWLIEKGMPLTEENLNALYGLKNLEVPKTMEQIVSAAAAAIANGNKAGSANIADGRTNLEKAADYIEDVNSISDEAVDKVAAEGRRLDLRSLKAAQLQINLSLKAESYTVSRNGRLLMEGVRLQMTVEANLRLIGSGFSIDTAELEELVAALKEAEQQTENNRFGKTALGSSGEAAGIYRDTLSAVKELCGMPAALSGRFAFRGRVQIHTAEASFTLKAVYEEGITLRSAYEKAGESYETLMTAPRADLGDSIKKAFRNVDDILKEMNLEASEENRRAVRILGYNSMEISEENLEAVKTTDLSIRRVLNKMTPASVLQMVREGINPLSMDMEELESCLNDQQRSPEQELEKYSEYLYKLEKNHSITEPERDAYIGIYRLFRQLEKTDGAAIGTLISQGAEPTVRNLLSAMRSNKKHGMDITVDDGFAGIDSSYTGKSISGQIESGISAGYYKKLAADIFDNLDGSRMNAVPADGSMNLEQLSEMLYNTPADEEVNREYIRQCAGELRKSMQAEDSVVKELLDFDQPVTADNLLAAGLRMKERGKAAGRLSQLASQSGREDELEEAVHALHESMTGEEPAKKAYDRLDQVYREVLEDVVYDQEASGRIDLKEIGSLYKQIALSAGMAKEENYEVPVEIGGEVTAVSLKIIHGGRENGRVTASMESAVYGRAAAQLQIVPGEDGGYQLSGYITGDNPSFVKGLEESGEGLKKMLEQSDIKTVSLNYIYNSGLDLTAVSRGMAAGKTGEAATTATTVTTKKLYDIAKIFIGYIQKGEGTEYENQL